MKINTLDISKQIYAEDTLDVLINRYGEIGPHWTSSQMEWCNSIFKAFKDHDKFLIVMFLTMKTLSLYSRHFTKLTYDEFFSGDTFEIEKFNIVQISKNLNIPKESARRKIIELEKNGVIKRNKKNKIFIDRSAFPFIKPINSIIRISRFLAAFSQILTMDKILTKKISSIELEKLIKDNFSYIWKIYYEFQIPMLLGYKKVFGDIETFHIFGTCVVNQHLYSQKKGKLVTRNEFLNALHTDNNMQGVNAMSISDITGIPRATVVRKLKKLLKINCLIIDDKKHYRVSGNFVKKLMPLQKTVLNQLADFSTKIYNLKIL